MEDLLGQRITAIYFIVGSYKVANLELPVEESEIIKFLLDN